MVNSVPFYKEWFGICFIPSESFGIRPFGKMMGFLSVPGIRG